jgi:hypothetical protein
MQQPPSSKIIEIKPKLRDKIDVALEALERDPGAIFEEDVLAQLREVRRADSARWQRIRTEAKKRGAQVSELDKLTAPVDEDRGISPMFPDVEPHADPVDGSTLLHQMHSLIAAHVIAEPETYIAAALWCAHTWMVDAFSVGPIARITAPEKRCGKSVLLSTMGKLVSRPLATANISPAALFRCMEAWQPTLLIDEVDAFLKENEEARGIINSGLYKAEAFVIRTVGDDFTPTKFSTWGPKVLCGIGSLASTIEDRSIPLRLRRKVAGENTANVRHSDPSTWASVQTKLARWAADNAGRAAIHRPEKVPGLNDRAQDCWEPLLTVADLAGGGWPELARKAAMALHGVQDENPSANVELLSDIKAIFERRGASKLTTSLLLELLVEDDEAPWATWNRGRPMSARQLAARLKEFGIEPVRMRPDGTRQVRGYDKDDFADAFKRYL